MIRIKYCMKNIGISEKKALELIEKIETQEKFAKAIFPNATDFFKEAHVFRVVWDDIKDLVEYTHYIN